MASCNASIQESWACIRDSNLEIWICLASHKGGLVQLHLPMDKLRVLLRTSLPRQRQLIIGRSGNQVGGRTCWLETFRSNGHSGAAGHGAAPIGRGDGRFTDLTHLNHIGCVARQVGDDTRAPREGAQGFAGRGVLEPTAPRVAEFHLPGAEGAIPLLHMGCPGDRDLGGTGAGDTELRRLSAFRWDVDHIMEDLLMDRAIARAHFPRLQFNA